MPKLIQILEQSSATRKAVCVSVFFLFRTLYKTNGFHVAVGLFSNRSRNTSSAARVPLLCFYHILTSSVTYITEQTHGNMESIC